MVFHEQILPFLMSRPILKPHALSTSEIENLDLLLNLADLGL